MEAGLREQVAFYLTGLRTTAEVEAIDEFTFRPALMAAYRDLTQLRYDFPLVLVGGESADADCVQPLSVIIDRAVVEICRDVDDERVTHQALRIEREIRAEVATGTAGSLSELWDKAAGRLVPQGNGLFDDTLKRLRAAIDVDGEVIDCDQAMPVKLFRHVWSTVQAAKEKRARREIDRLILRLSEILMVDFGHSQAGLSPESLEASVGSPYADVFDFDAMSRLLSQSATFSPLPVSRRRRIETLLSVLGKQRFFGAPQGASETAASQQHHSFVFTDCASALAAWHDRLPEAIELAKAMAIAELEIDTRYSEQTHDTLFAEFGVNGLDDQEMSRFPDYLLCIDAERLRGAETDTFMEILSAGLPVKILLQTDDLLNEAASGNAAHLTFGRRNRELVSMALGLGNVFVLQAAASHLHQCRERILSGLAADGPALFSVFSGANGNTRGLPPYLTAAAATDSRVFPAFSYEPAAGDNWATRFRLEAIAQVDRDWPVQHFAYEDEQHQRVIDDINFTAVDFIACDRRFAGHFVRASQESRNGELVPVAYCLDNESTDVPGQIPFILMVDDENQLQKFIVDRSLIRVTRRCRDTWHSLQELGGVHNSHAERLLAREREAWEEQAQQSSVHTLPPAPPPAGSLPAAEQVASAEDVAPAEQQSAHSADEAYIETARCTTCNECTQINNRMFGYDENNQARIVDVSAGTYRQLVEAAENCQVAIIHPGKPINPNEPGIEELIERARPFL